MSAEKRGRTDWGSAAKSADNLDRCALSDSTVYHEANVREVRYLLKTTAREAYGRLCDFAKRRAEAQRPFGVQEWAEAERRHPRANGSGDDFRINNSFLPIYARILATDLPEVRPYVELRKSVYDVFFPELKRGSHGA